MGGDIFERGKGLGPPRWHARIFSARSELFSYARVKGYFDKGAEPMAIKIPSGLTKEAKRLFKQVVKIREEASMPIAPGEIDLISDYAQARLRIIRLNELLESDSVKQSPQLFIQTAKQAEATALASARLSRLLRLEEAHFDMNRLPF